MLGRFILPTWLSVVAVAALQDGTSSVVSPPQVSSAAVHGNFTGDKTGRIIGGKQVSGINEYPWSVFLTSTIEKPNRPTETSNCGGSIISCRAVVTAAHCVDRRHRGGGRATEVEVRAGCKNRFSSTCEIIKVPGDKIIVHENYATDAQRYDIALINLDTDISFNQDIQLILLRSNKVHPGEQLKILGWGNNRNLKEADVKAVSCTGYNYPANIIDYTICAKKTSGTTGGTYGNGDSGGPLIRRRDDDQWWKLVGVISWKGSGGVMGAMRISKFKGWIGKPSHWFAKIGRCFRK